MLIRIIVSILVGAFFGWIAGKLMKSEGSFWRNVVIGIAGGALGGLLGNFVGLGDGWVSSLIVSIGGPCLLIWIVNKLK